MAIAEYYRALTAAANDPRRNTDALARRISSRCPCREVLRVLRDQAAKGHRLDYRYTVRDLKIIEVSERGAAALYLVVQSPGRQLDERGRVVASYGGSKQKFSAHFIRRDGVWLLHRANEVR